MRIFAVLALNLAAGAASAECPAVPDASAEMARLRAGVQEAPSEEAARVFTSRMWEIWVTAPDARAQELLDRGRVAFELGDLVAAIAAYDDLIAYCPDYAEGYNQRAFMNFLGARFDLARPDLERALDLNPDHIAARSGLALTLMGLGLDAEAQRVLREALTQNPWLPERRYVTEVPGEDL